MRRRNAPRLGSNHDRPPPPRDPKPGGDRPHIVLVSAGLALYLAVLWLGVFVIRDTPGRSAVMAGLIVAIAAAGYLFTHQPTRPRDR